jgi:hypothetical protein
VRRLRLPPLRDIKDEFADCPIGVVDDPDDDDDDDDDGKDD